MPEPLLAVEGVRAGYGAKADAMLAAYPHASDGDAWAAMKNVFRDGAFGWPTWAWARLQTQYGKGKAFVYYFDHRTPQSPNGATHAAELSYVFGNFGGPQGGAPRPEDTKMSDLMMDYWTNFAKSGDPNGAKGLPQWPKFDTKTRATMVLNDDSVVTNDPFGAERQLLAAEGRRVLLDRDRFARQRRFVHLQVDGFDQARVGGNPVPRTQVHHVAWHDLARRDLRFLSVAENVRGERRHPPKRLEGPLRAILLHVAENDGEENDGADREGLDVLSEEQGICTDSLSDCVWICPLLQLDVNVTSELSIGGSQFGTQGILYSRHAPSHGGVVETDAGAMVCLRRSSRRQQSKP